MTTELVLNYEEESQRVKEALRPIFPEDTIATRPGYQGRVHLIIVSERFNGMNERQKQEELHGLLRDRLGADAQVVSLAIAYSPDEL